MTIQNWQNNQWQMTQAPVQGQPPLDFAPTGLLVALQVRGVEAPMVKAFLLGGI
jgi:hypothetical protein